MLKYLVLIDNDCVELKKLKGVLQNDANKKNIEIVDICTGIIQDSTNEDENIKKVIEQIKELIENTTIETNKLQLHIVADACLTREEEELASIKDCDYLSGIKYLEGISNYLQKTNCTFYLSLMSRFFAKQLSTFHRLQKFKSNEKNNFLAVIKKPILDNGDIDPGSSIAVDYIDILPENLLSKNYLDSFKNILIFKLGGMT